MRTEVVKYDALDAPLMTLLWEVYDAAFEPLKSASPCRQSFNRCEFEEACVSRHVAKFVLFEDDEACGLAMGTYDAHQVSWINPEFFSSNYPDTYAKGFGYLQGIVTRRASRGGVIALLRAAIETVPAGGICCFDHSYFANAPISRLARMAGRRICAEPVLVERQDYYVMVRV